MKKSIIITLALILSFGLGFAFNNFTRINNEPKTGHVTGIGGIFFKCKNPKKMREWYKTHLGINTNPYGAIFEWRHATDSTQKGFTNWTLFKDSSTYFAPSTKDFMINYRVDNLAALVDELKKDSVTVVDKIETVEYGKFVHILDAEGNKVELWEPNDVAYGKLVTQMGTKTTK